VGVLLAIVGLVAHFAGTNWINLLMPPVVTGAIVAIIGLNLAPTAGSNFLQFPITGLVTLGAIVLINVIFSEKSMISRLSILVGVVVGYVFAITQGQVDFEKINAAAWFGVPQFTTPDPNFGAIIPFLPVVLVLIAENIGHVKSVSAMTGANLDAYAGRALLADGIGTILAGLGGGSGTTTYAENIGVMAATKVYSTAAYWVAAIGAMILALCPKFGAIVNSVPIGVLGGVTVLLYGMIGLLGVRIWVDNNVDFKKMNNIIVAAVTLVIGIADGAQQCGGKGCFSFTFGEVQINGIVIGAVSAIVLYHLLHIKNKTKRDPKKAKYFIEP
jgi:uracil-xanthine permease